MFICPCHLTGWQDVLPPNTLPPSPKKSFTHEIKPLFHDLPVGKRTPGCQLDMVKNNYLYNTNMYSYNSFPLVHFLKTRFKKI